MKLADYARQCPHTEAQARCEHRDTGTRQDISSGDPERWIWWCRGCGQTFQFNERTVSVAEWNEFVRSRTTT